MKAMHLPLSDRPSHSSPRPLHSLHEVSTEMTGSDRLTVEASNDRTRDYRALGLAHFVRDG